MTEPAEKHGQVKRLELNKDGKAIVFRYHVGEEQTVLNNLIEMVQDPTSDLDWFDAAVLSHQMGRHMQHRLTSMARAPSASPASDAPDA